MIVCAACGGHGQDGDTLCSTCGSYLRWGAAKPA
ncbi:MAG: hypothetical protein QOF96_988, partial [Actinomycetota bacterium]|nr:hypothetical protein [Actinomycetota bacterium]